MGVVARQMRNHLRGNSSFFDDQFFDNAMADKMYENYINKSFLDKKIYNIFIAIILIKKHIVKNK